MRQGLVIAASNQDLATQFWKTLRRLIPLFLLCRLLQSESNTSSRGVDETLATASQDALAPDLGCSTVVAEAAF